MDASVLSSSSIKMDFVFSFFLFIETALKEKDAENRMESIFDVGFNF